MTYAKQLNAHLSAYKIARLGVQEPGTFVYRGREVSYDHILPKEHQWLNLLETFRSDIQHHLERHPEIKLHRYFHHLNSSQAFALNLFFPYFERGGAQQLLAALGSTGELSSWQAEWITDLAEGTNVDIAWQAGGATTYCEVKLSEQEFGTAPNDCAHRVKLDEIYRPALAGACDPELLLPERFFQNYQLFRNVWLVARNPESRLIFLAPRANASIWRKLSAFLKLLGPPLAARVRAVAAEDVLASLAAAEHLPASLFGYAALLREKYVPPPAA